MEQGSGAVGDATTDCLFFFGEDNERGYEDQKNDSKRSTSKDRLLGCFASRALEDRILVIQEMTDDEEVGVQGK